MTLVGTASTRRSHDGSALVDVIAYATIAFLYERETPRSISRVLARLRQGLEVDHTLLAPLDPAGPGQSWSTVDCRDFGPGRAALQQAEGWIKDLAQGSVVAVNADRCRVADREGLTNWGAVSLLIAPVFVNGRWWGILAALDERRPHSWTKLHRKLMLAVAGTLSAALQSDVDSDSLQESKASLLFAQNRADSYRKRLDELILASRDAIMVIEPDGFVSRWNQSADALFGFGHSARPGRSWRDFLPFTMRQMLGDMVDEARQGRATHVRACEVGCGQGCVYLLVSAFPLGDPPGTVAVVACDQTETVLVRDRLERSLEATIEALAAAMEARDPYTAGHQRRTAEMARGIAQVMGLPEDEVRGVYTAAIIHDIGKICVPAEILTCPRRLNEPEMALIRMHPQAGHDIVRTVAFPWPVADLILQHHERMDGSGYPGGLVGEQILLGARIIGVADMVEAVTNHRPYRAALGIEKARTELANGRGKTYDPMVVDSCLKVLAEEG